MIRKIFILFFLGISLGKSVADDEFEDLGENLYKDHRNYKYFNLKSCGQAIFNPYPWMVLIIHENQETGEKYGCGGSLITNSTILTSARCVIKKPGHKLAVQIGKSLKRSRSRTEFGENLLEIIRYPGFAQEGETYTNDIALIRLTEPVTIGEYPKP
jgi:hypothetical protein